MKRRAAVLASLLAVLFAGIVFMQARGFGSQSSQSSPSQEELSIQAGDRDASARDAAWRYEHSQPRHWRACLLQH